MARLQAPRYAIRRPRANAASQNSGIVVSPTAAPIMQGADVAGERLDDRVAGQDDPGDDEPGGERGGEEPQVGPPVPCLHREGV